MTLRTCFTHRFEWNPFKLLTKIFCQYSNFNPAVFRNFFGLVAKFVQIYFVLR